ncbi:hypothetical protein [Streptomyces naphthomycinicus]|uniref:hypothetical protein n=1 Tax=Streptomyces naphthomycinicus TaxID=2872625 RepID=UPI001CECA27F|nr:hypothetical protein [Streptomyces sp. TML10]
MALGARLRRDAETPDLGSRRAGHALLIHPRGELSPQALAFAEGLPDDPDHQVVVLDLPRDPADGTWPVVARLLGRGAAGGYRLVMGRTLLGGTVPVGQWLADRLDRAVVVPDGAVVPAAGGVLYIPADRGPGWVRLLPRRSPTPVSRRFPKPAWEFTLSDQAWRTSGRTVVDPLPSGVWLHGDGHEGALTPHREVLVSRLAYRPELLTVVLGCPGGDELSLDDVARFWHSLLPGVRDLVRFVPYGPLAVPDGPGPGQALADRLDVPVTFDNGLPVSHAAGEAPEVHALDADGSPGWAAFVRQLRFTPARLTGGHPTAPVVVGHRPAFGDLLETAPGRYRYDDAVLEVVPSGLWLRPSEEPDEHGGSGESGGPGASRDSRNSRRSSGSRGSRGSFEESEEAAVIRSAAPSARHVNVVFGTAAHGGGRMRELAERLLQRLDPALRAMARLVPAVQLVREAGTREPAAGAAAVAGTGIGSGRVPEPAAYTYEAEDLTGAAPGPAADAYGTDTDAPAAALGASAPAPATAPGRGGAGPRVRLATAAPAFGDAPAERAVAGAATAAAPPEAARTPARTPATTAGAAPGTPPPDAADRPPAGRRQPEPPAGAAGRDPGNPLPTPGVGDLALSGERRSASSPLGAGGSGSGTPVPAAGVGELALSGERRPASSPVGAGGSGSGTPVPAAGVGELALSGERRPAPSPVGVAGPGPGVPGDRVGAAPAPVPDPSADEHGVHSPAGLPQAFASYLPPTLPEDSSGPVPGGVPSGGEVSAGPVSGGVPSGGEVSAGPVSGGVPSGGEVATGEASGGVSSEGEVSAGVVPDGVPSPGRPARPLPPGPPLPSLRLVSAPGLPAPGPVRDTTGDGEAPPAAPGTGRPDEDADAQPPVGSVPPVAASAPDSGGAVRAGAVPPAPGAGTGGAPERTPDAAPAVADGGRPVPAAAPGVRVQAVPSPAACAVPPRNGIAREREWLRGAFRQQYNDGAGAVARLLSEVPGLRGTAQTPTEDVLTDLVAARLYLRGDSALLDRQVRAATVGPHIPLARCVAAGVRRLPSYRGATVLRAALGGAEWDWYRHRTLVTEWAFCWALTAAAPELPGDTDILIWSMTARRTALLAPDQPARVLFLPGTTFKVLAVRDGDRRAVLLRELSASEISADGRVDTGRTALDDMALSGLEQADRTWQAGGPGTAPGLPPEQAVRFTAPPGLLLPPPPAPPAPPGKRTTP